MLDYTLLVPSSPAKTPLLNNLLNSYKKYKNDFTKEPVIFGGEGRTSCYHTKVLDMLEVLKTLSSEYVMCIDGWDLIFNKGLDDSLFDDFKDDPNLEFVFAAETNCFPYSEFSDFFASHANTEMKYLNAGVIIAKRESYISALEKYSNPNNYDQQEFFQKSDQAISMLMHKDSLEKGDGKVIIDSEARISMQMFQLEKDKDYTLNEEKQATYLATGNTPFFVHFNGDGKNQMPHFEIEYGK